MQKFFWGMVFSINACGTTGFDVHIRFMVMHFMQVRAYSRGLQAHRRLPSRRGGWPLCELPAIELPMGE
jgi:hypothetical protein